MAAGFWMRVFLRAEQAELMGDLIDVIRMGVEVMISCCRVKVACWVSCRLLGKFAMGFLGEVT